MHPLLQQADWPALAPPYDAALREAAGYIAGRYAVLGLVASGTIIRGSPDPTSDLDLVVIHPEPWRQRVQKRFNGVPAEIFVNPPHVIRRYFRTEQAEARPSTAHMIATGHVLLARDPVVGELRREARALLEAGPGLEPAALEQRRYHAATLYEDARDRAATDPDNARLLLAEAVATMLRFRALAAGGFVPRGKDLLARTAEVDAEAADLARRIVHAGTAEEAFRAGDALADRVLGVRGFFEWEGEIDPTPMQEGEG